MAATHDVIVVGAGAAGLTAAGGCAMFGLRVALIERDRMGGECLNTGCVPSKALIAAAARAHAVRDAARFGVRCATPSIDFAAVRAHVQAAISQIAPHDAPARLQALGVEVIAAEARFLDRRSISAGGQTLSAPRIVLATGSRPLVPPVPGLEAGMFLTNETLFELDVLPCHLAILGGGSVGIEMAQAFVRLGAQVTVIDTGRCLAAADQEAAALVLARLRHDGVRLIEQAELREVRRRGEAVVLLLGSGEVEASHILVASGRSASIAGLDLAAAGIKAGPDGILVDARRRTSNRRVFAIGDCRAGPRFTHLAAEEGSVVVRNIALGWPAKVDLASLPRVIFTDPELAQLGRTEAQTPRAAIERQPFADDDRAITEGQAEGFVKLVRRGRRLAGVTIVGAGAAEMLLPWSQVQRGRASLLALAGTVVAYPTRSERSKAAAFAVHKAAVFSPTVKRWVKLLAWARRLAMPDRNDGP